MVACRICNADARVRFSYGPQRFPDGTGIHDRFKTCCRKDSEFDSRGEHICSCGGTVYTLVLETNVARIGGSTPLKSTELTDEALARKIVMGSER